MTSTNSWKTQKDQSSRWFFVKKNIYLKSMECLYHRFYNWHWPHVELILEQLLKIHLEQLHEGQCNRTVLSVAHRLRRQSTLEQHQLDLTLSHLVLADNHRHQGRLYLHLKNGESETLLLSRTERFHANEPSCNHDWIPSSDPHSASSARERLVFFELGKKKFQIGFKSVFNHAIG